MQGDTSGSATGDIAIAVLRRKGDIGVPVYVWIDLGSGPSWVDFATLTAPQFSAWVDSRTAFAAQQTTKTVGVTLSRDNTW